MAEKDCCCGCGGGGGGGGGAAAATTACLKTGAWGLNAFIHLRLTYLLNQNSWCSISRESSTS